jgi:hypothetical protein
MPTKKVGKKVNKKLVKKPVKKSKNLVKIKGGNLENRKEKMLMMDDKKEIDYVSETQDHFYVNAIMNNLSDSPVPATYRETRESSILQKPNDYTVSIIRFALDSGVLPIFNFKPSPGTYSSGNTNPNLGEYTITLSYGGVDYEENVIFVSQDAGNFEFDPPNIQGWEIINEQNFTYYQVFDYQNFLDMINSALANAYARVSSIAPPKLAGASAPYLQLDQNTGIISLMANIDFDPDTLAGATIQIFMSRSLYAFFDNFPAINVNGSNGKEILLVVKNLGNNLITQQPIISFFQPWYNYVTYNLGDNISFFDPVTVTKSNYRSLINGNIGNNPSTTPLAWRREGLYNALLTYSANEIVFNDGSWYRSINNGNIGHTPKTSPTFWELSVPEIPPTNWDPTRTYFLNNVVTYLGTYYKSITDPNLGNIPSSSITNWIIYSAFDMYRMSQQYESLYNWNDITTIVITSSEIPTVQEYVPTQGQSNQQNSSIASSSRQILTDFAIASSTGFDIKEPIVFTNQGEYRLINLSSDSQWRTIDLKFYWTDTNNQFFPIFIAPGGKSYGSSKLLFRRRLFNQ